MPIVIVSRFVGVCTTSSAGDRNGDLPAEAWQTSYLKMKWDHPACRIRLAAEFSDSWEGTGSMTRTSKCETLRGPVLTLACFLYFPVRKGILMSTVRTFPSTLAGVDLRLVEHADDQVALQTHRRLAVNPFAFNNFCHFSKTLCLCRAHPLLRWFPAVWGLDDGNRKTAPLSIKSPSE